MANSTIIITFTEDLPIGAKLGIDLITPEWLYPYGFYEKWVNVRSFPFQVSFIMPAPAATLIAGEATAIKYAEAVNLDLAGYGCIVSRFENVVTIAKEVPSTFALITEYFDYIDNVVVPFEKHPSIEIAINNVAEDVFTIDSVVLSPGLNPCTHVQVTVATNVLAVKMIRPFLINPNLVNPIVFETLRGANIGLELENNNATKARLRVLIPSILNASNFSILVNNGPNGATAIVQNANTTGLILEYSLDGSVWLASSTFSGLAVGNYALFVRDNFGCSFNLSFHIDEFGIQTPYFYISKANSVRYANRISWGDSENYKTDENTLSCEVDVQLAYKEFQQFQSADIITTQFKSNYSSNTASIIKEDGVIINIPVDKKSNNIGIKDKRDARKYNLGNGKTGIYFISGNIYDYTSNAILNTYSLNGLLPEWAQIGNYFEIAGFWYLIEQILFDESKNADIIVYTNTYAGLESNVVAASIFNRFNYEVYEYTIDMVDYINQKFRVKLISSNINFTTVTHLSELIWCKVKHENLIEIRYRNNTNTDVDYSTGIEHKIRIPYLKVSGKTDEQSEVHKTDTDAILLNADLYESDDFQFEPVTKEIWRKLMIALSHEKVLLNGVGYVKNGSFNTEGPIELSNLYVLTAAMIKTGNVYNSQTSGNLDFDGSEVEVPGLISTNSGYLKY